MHRLPGTYRQSFTRQSRISRFAPSQCVNKEERSPTTSAGRLKRLKPGRAGSVGAPSNTPVVCFVASKVIFRLSLSTKLNFVELGVSSLGGEQLLVGPRFNNPTPFEDEYDVAAAHCGQAVRT